MFRSLLSEAAVFRRSFQAAASVARGSAAVSASNNQLQTLFNPGKLESLCCRGLLARVWSTRAVTDGASPTGFQKRQINYLGSQSSMASRLDPRVHQKYMDLPTPGKVMATYIWIDGTGQVRDS